MTSPKAADQIAELCGGGEMKSYDIQQAEKAILQKEFCIDCPRREAQDALIERARELLTVPPTDLDWDGEKQWLRERDQWLKDAGVGE